MKQIEVSALGMEEMTANDIVNTNGGSMIALAIIAAVGLIATGCTANIQINIKSPHSENVHKADTTVRNGGTDVVTDVSVIPAP